MTTKKHNSKSKGKTLSRTITHRKTFRQTKQKISSTLQLIKVQCLEPRFAQHNSTMTIRLYQSRLSLGSAALQLSKIGKGSYLFKALLATKT